MAAKYVQFKEMRGKEEKVWDLGRVHKERILKAYLPLIEFVDTKLSSHLL